MTRPSPSPATGARTWFWCSFAISPDYPEGEYLSQLRRRHQAIRDRQATVLAVSFEPRERLAQLSRQMQLPFPLVSDPQKGSYQDYGLTAGSLRRVWAWGTVWAYLKLLARGNRYRFGSGDTRQMGGDFVLDRYGTVVYEFRSASPHQRPSMEELLSVLDGLQDPA